MKITRKVGNLCELRGITFVKEDDGDWKRYLFMSKFFNVNQTSGVDVCMVNLNINGIDNHVSINKLYQTEDGFSRYRAVDLKKGLTVAEYDRATDKTTSDFITIETIKKTILKPENVQNSWMFDDLKELEICRVANKEDGSAIRFLIVNDELVAKTKFSFEAEQTKMAMEVVNNNNNKLKSFIFDTLNNGLTALFELVSPFNKIVLSYNETDLKLTQLRDDVTGNYLDIYNHHLVLQHGIRTAESESLELLNSIASLYSTDEIREKVGELKFNSLEDFLLFLKK